LIAGAFAPLARVWNWPYLEAMARPVSAPNGMLSALPPRARAATVYYGTTVFFEMIAAGIAACF
jgi:hypothetical protein